MYADRLREARPRDQVVQAAVTGEGDGTITLHQIADTGLSTLVDDVSDDHRGAGWEVEDITVETRRLDALLEDAGWAGEDIHFIVIDTEGAERDVLETVDLHRWRPWILVVEATRPNGTEPTHEGWEHLVLGAGYRFCLFDGLSRFYVAEEKADELGPLLQTPANILDNYITHRQAVLSAELRRGPGRHDAPRRDQPRRHPRVADRRGAHLGARRGRRSRRSARRSSFTRSTCTSTTSGSSTSSSRTSAPRATRCGGPCRGGSPVRCGRCGASGRPSRGTLLDRTTGRRHPMSPRTTLTSNGAGGPSSRGRDPPPRRDRPRRPPRAGSTGRAAARRPRPQRAGRPGADRIWLLLTALCAAYPTTRGGRPRPAADRS